MVSKMSLARSAMFALATLLILGVAGSSQAAPRMYTGQLIILSFGNDTSTGSTAPFDAAGGVGIPLAGNCNEEPYHAKETITFPTYPTRGLNEATPVPSAALCSLYFLKCDSAGGTSLSAMAVT